MTEIELKCPRCGQESEVETGTAVGDMIRPFYILCSCGLQSPFCEYEPDLIRWWTQPFRPADALRERVKVLEKALRNLVNELSADIGVDPELLRGVIGNTNVFCLQECIKQAQAALNEQGEQDGRN